MADDEPFIVSDSELVHVTDDEISDEVIEMPDGEVIDHDRVPMSDDKPFIVSDSELVGVTDDEISDEVIEMPDDIFDEEDENQETVLTPRRKEKHVEQKSKPSSTISIRERVRDTLRKEIAQRMSENTTGPKLNEDEIKQFSFDTEIELYELFKDVGVKYKSRYRSLNFNIKDRKNLTLWQKICEKSITPEQLVQLTPEELASQELAEWRDNEVKHELDLIKKSELDLLAANKTYVLKTHKGVKVMESKTAVSTDLDPNMPVENVVTALNDSTEETPTSEPGNPDQDGDAYRKSIDSESDKASTESSRKRGRDTHSPLSKKKTKSVKTRSDKSRSTSKEKVSETRELRRKTPSLERSRSRSRAKSERRSKSRDSSRSRSHERSTTKGRSKSHSRSRHRSRSETKAKGN